MAEVHNFRSAFHGFNREDVVRYISYMNNKHNDQVNQLNSEKQALLDELNATKNLVPTQDLKELVAQLEAECAELKARCAEMEAAQEAAAAATQEAAERTIAEAELEAYRRAERMERIAKERADAVYHQVNATLAEASTQLSGAAGSYGQLVDSVVSQISQLQAAVESGKIALENAAAAMGAIRPEGSEE